MAHDQALEQCNAELKRCSGGLGDNFSEEWILARGYLAVVLDSFDKPSTPGTYHHHDETPSMKKVMEADVLKVDCYCINSIVHFFTIVTNGFPNVVIIQCSWYSEWSPWVTHIVPLDRL